MGSFFPNYQLSSALLKVLTTHKLWQDRHPLGNQLSFDVDFICARFSGHLHNRCVSFSIGRTSKFYFGLAVIRGTITWQQ
jgi:hypothetical protein